MLFSLVQELVPLWDVSSQILDGMFTFKRRCYIVPDPCLAEKAASDRIEAYNTFVSRVEELNLHEAVDAAPLLNVRPAAVQTLVPLVLNFS